MHASIRLVGLSAGVAVSHGSLGTVADEPATTGRPHAVRTTTPLGASSSSEFDPLRGFTLSAVGRSDVGTRGEPQVVRILVKHFARQGLPAKEVKPRDPQERRRWDAAKIDAKLRIGSDEFDVQITAVPGDAEHWALASRGHATRTGDVRGAAKLIQVSIDRKRNAASARMILALDARHAAVVVEAEVIAEYAKNFGEPGAAGFAAIVLVGPAAHLCATIASTTLMS